jgi:hypothetical protein
LHRLILVLAPDGRLAIPFIGTGGIGPLIRTFEVTDSLTERFGEER